ncbi:MAG: glycosyltransferase family 39 protein [Planctomycetes bacterium]|nr:glycosyltransferase family 39 protein [Planctomycetota bacterium]
MDDALRRRVRKVTPVAALLLLALTVRLAFLFTLEGKPFVAEPILDGAVADAWGQEIATRSFWGDRAFYQDPLYPYGLGIFNAIFGRHLLAVKILQVLIGVLGLAFLFEAARRIAGYAAAVATLAVAALYRTTAFYDVVLLKDFLGPFFIEAALLAGVLAVQRDRWGWWLLTGLSVGLAALVRGNLLLLAPLLAGSFWWMRQRRGAGLVLAGAALAIAPCTIRNAIVTKEFILTTAQLGPNLYIGNNPENWTGRYRAPSFMTAGSPEFEEREFRREAERRRGAVRLSAGQVSAYWRGEALESIRSQPWHFLLATFRRVMLLFNDWEVPDDFNVSFMRRFSWALALPWMTFGLVLWPLAAAGLYFSWIERRKHVLGYVLLAGALVPVAFFFVVDRYRLPGIPLLFFFAGYGIVRGAETLRWGMKRVPKTAAAIAAAALVQANLPASIYGVGDTSFFAQRYNLARWHERHGEPMSAALEMERAFELRPEVRDDPRMAVFAAGCYLEAGRVPEALPLYLRVRDHAGAARCYVKLGEPNRAVALFTKAMAESPPEVGLRLELAEALMKVGRIPEALGLLSRAAGDFPGDPGPPLGQARIYRQTHLWREAAAAAEEAMRRAPRGLPEAEAILREARAQLGQ